MAIGSKNKYPADKTGSKYSEFKNTKRTSSAKARTTGAETKPAGSGSDRTAGSAG